MKESYKWTLLINKYFPSNNKTLYELAKELEDKSKLTMVRQKDYFTSKQKIQRILDNSDDVTDVLSSNVAYNVERIKQKDLIDGILIEPHKYLKSVISLWEVGDEITRLDGGAVELKYLFKGNGLWQNKENEEC